VIRDAENHDQRYEDGDYSSGTFADYDNWNPEIRRAQRGIQDALAERLAGRIARARQRAMTTT